MKTLKINITGAQLKALVSDSLTETAADFTLTTGLFGATSGDVVLIPQIGVFNTEEVGSYWWVFSISPDSTMHFDKGLDPSSASSVVFGDLVPAGDLLCRITNYEADKTLADIPDTLSFDLYLTGGIVEEVIL